MWDSSGQCPEWGLDAHSDVVGAWNLPRSGATDGPMARSAVVSAGRGRDGSPASVIADAGAHCEWDDHGRCSPGRGEQSDRIDKSAPGIPSVHRRDPLPVRRAYSRRKPPTSRGRTSTRPVRGVRPLDRAGAVHYLWSVTRTPVQTEAVRLLKTCSRPGHRRDEPVPARLKFF